MTEQMINPAINDYKDFVKFYAFDCRNKESKARFSICKKEQSPFFQVIKPNDVRYNPETQEVMRPRDIPFGDDIVTYDKVKTYIEDNMPEFAVQINSLKKLQEF